MKFKLHILDLTKLCLLDLKQNLQLVQIKNYLLIFYTFTKRKQAIYHHFSTYIIVEPGFSNTIFLFPGFMIQFTIDTGNACHTALPIYLLSASNEWDDGCQKSYLGKYMDELFIHGA